MTAKDLIAEDIIPLCFADTGEEALTTMKDFCIQHLPIVQDDELIGLISENDVIDYGIEAEVGKYPLELQKYYVYENAHIYEVVNAITEQRLTVLPVVDSQNKYLGLISQSDLLLMLSRMGSFSEPGSILVLRMLKRDYSLSQIARIAEGENVIILSSWTHYEVNAMYMEVTLKLNKTNVMTLISAFERFDFEVKGTFQEDEYTDVLRERYESFIRYLNV